MIYCKCGHAETSHDAKYGCYYNYNCDCSAFKPVDLIEDLAERVKHLEEQISYLESRLNMENDE